MARRTLMFIGAIALLLPIGLRLGLPALLWQLERWSWVRPILASAAPTRVEAVEGNTLSLKANGHTQSVQLLGLQPLSQKELAQTDGVLAIVLPASQEEVQINHTESLPSGQVASLVALPSGLTLQQILLGEGVAKLDPSAIQALPMATQQILKQAQSEAQTQHRNLWAIP